jgi:ribonucleotide reductase alpha subunit
MKAQSGPSSAPATFQTCMTSTAKNLRKTVRRIRENGGGPENSNSSNEVEALELWRKMLSMLFETGHPWITFKDPSNIRSPQDHVGVVHSSNLCTEILLNTSKEETAVCNLGSINLASTCTEKGLDEKMLAQTIRTAVRMLDNVIDINFYPTAEAQKLQRASHRPIGHGHDGLPGCALYP